MRYVRAAGALEWSLAAAVKVMRIVCRPADLALSALTRPAVRP